MNVDLLQAVQQEIARAPHRFCPAQWAFARNAEAVLRQGAVPEGFRCCIAGHVLLQSRTCTERMLLRKGGFHTGGELWAEAARTAGLSSDQSRELFFPSQWEHPFKQQYYLCAREEEAGLASLYMDHFLSKYAEGALQSGRPITQADREDRPATEARRPSEAAERTEPPRMTVLRSQRT
ncbi:MAG: hypothetical protein BRD55_03300 [Bacteroidetes bacterium SW_9_63_38]|nr:MAG: hypothetical protein BRD55_03300 [Bacteroidetes bacterium SW_9_63_38]